MKKLVLVAVCALGLAACNDAHKDASSDGQSVDRAPAEVIAMPDGFRNIADKCDHHGHRVFTTSTGASGNGAQVYAVADPSCR